MYFPIRVSLPALEPDNTFWIDSRDVVEIKSRVTLQMTFLSLE